MARTGRRPGDSGTREAILAAARTHFAERGFRGATIRGIAAEAGVDPALVHHFFGTKQELFAAIIEFPVSPAMIRERLEAVPAQAIGEQLTRTFLTIWGMPDAQDRLRALLRTAVTDERAMRMIREFVLETILEPIARRVGPDEPRLRASLAGTQLIGFGLLRYVFEVEPLASAPPDRVVAALAPTVQRYLTGSI